jgi:hypothetical protein
MTAHAILRRKSHRKAAGVLMLPFALFAGLILALGAFLAYVLWPSWPNAPVALDAPTVPVTVAGILFDVPPAAIRTAVQRHPGAHERIDLVFAWPTLTPPVPAGERPAAGGDDTPAAALPPGMNGRLFVTIAALGAVLPPIERLRTIYPRYVQAQASAGAHGLAVLPFRAGTPYEGEDLVYVAANPEQFFARCTRPVRAVPGTCIHERVLDAAELTLRFPRDWLQDWGNLAAGFERLVAQLHGADGRQATEKR